MNSVFRNILSPANKSRVVELLKGNSARVGRKRKRAAVLVPMFIPVGKDAPEIFFTVRSSTLTHHRSQVSFPGGVMDEGDQSLVDTALRETKEELGINPEQVSVWGSLPAMPDREGTANIVPVLGGLGEFDPASLVINEDEVEQAFHLSLEHLSNPVNHSYTRFSKPMSSLHFPVYHGGPSRIWGLTGFILDAVLSVVLPSEMNYKMISDRYPYVGQR